MRLLWIIALAQVFASAPALAAPGRRGTESFALVVTNNRSQVKHRPNLHYADDDGARYYRMFQNVVPAKQLVLLTRFDRASRRLYPRLAEAALPPTGKHLGAAIERLAGQVARARARGARTVLYFVFAGHGHVQRGKGYLELEDGRLGPRALERQLLDKVKAEVVHLVLDSCNSFFVINPRKPGGKRWATPKDMTQGFARRYPHVGVFLSTSAAGEVYEWSELQSGIFSHEVRSGLSGAADADGDGAVSYDELRGFVAVANKRVRNEQYRPKVFSRAPHQKGRATLLSYRGATGPRLALGREQLRLWVRDGEGNRLVDVHKEAGQAMELVLPAMPAGDVFSVQIERAASGALAQGRPTLEEVSLPVVAAHPVEGTATSAPADSQPTTRPAQPRFVLAALARRPAQAQARGPDQVFEQVFREPYGPRAFRRQQRGLAKDSGERLVFGISWRDEIRMRHYLSGLSRANRQDRLMNGGVFIGAGVLLGGGAGYALVEGGGEVDGTARILGYALVGSSVALAGAGLYQLFSRSDGEKAYDTFDREIRRPGARRELVIARTEAHLRELAASEARRRRLASWLSFAGAAVYFGMGVGFALEDAYGDKLFDNPTPIYLAAFGGGALMLGLGVAMRYIRTPLERMLDLYHDDPDLNISLGVAPLPGGGALGVSGTF